MASDTFVPLAEERHVSLTTYRRSGRPVPTALWFVLHEGALYARTLAHSGKVKRLRNRPDVEVAACTASGAITGPAIEASARILADSDPLVAVADQLLDERYGEARRSLTRARDESLDPVAYIEIRPRQ